MAGVLGSDELRSSKRVPCAARSKLKVHHMGLTDSSLSLTAAVSLSPLSKEGIYFVHER
jgi:hypothetical protein